MSRRRRWLAAAGAAALVGSLGGCFQGPNASTSTQQESGNGSVIEVGPITMQAVTVVAGNTGSGAATLTATMVNADGPLDRLEAVEIDGRPGQLEPTPIEAPAGGSAKIGESGDGVVIFAGVSKAAGEYADVTFTFAQAGEVTAPVLIVPPVGFYEGAAPAGTTPEPRPTFDVHGGEE